MSASSIAVTTHGGAALPEELAEGLSSERLALWNIERALWSPRTLVATGADGKAQGAALTASRAFSAYRKVVDVIAADDAVWERLVRAAQDDQPDSVTVTSPAPIAVHVEEHFAIEPFTPRRREALAALGFDPAPQPVPSIPSTRPGDSTEVAAWTWWRDERPARIAPYYGQTTDVTCGAVAAMMGLELLGRAGFDPESLDANRTSEISFWRQATNLPACEPVGLSVETARAGEGLLQTLPRVMLSTDSPVLLEEFPSGEWEHALRTDLQQHSLQQAEAAGIPIERRWVEVDEIADAVRNGAQALLLIDLTELISDPTPHWVLATDVVGEHLIISDPWVQVPNGETWVDTYALPLPFSTVDRVTRWGDPAYRGVIILEGSR